MRKLAAVLLVLAMGVPVWPALGLGGETTDVVWIAENAGVIVASVTRVRKDGSIDHVVWSNLATVYQEYAVLGRGYNGMGVKMTVREIRPFQNKADAATNLGMRDPDTLFRAAKVAWGARTDDSKTGVVTFIDVRQVGVNYLIVVTEMTPLKPVPEGPPVKL